MWWMRVERERGPEMRERGVEHGEDVEEGRLGVSEREGLRYFFFVSQLPYKSE
jgi:hypothetical protein